MPFRLVLFQDGLDLQVQAAVAVRQALSDVFMYGAFEMPKCPAAALTVEAFSMIQAARSQALSSIYVRMSTTPFERIYARFCVAYEGVGAVTENSSENQGNFMEITMK